MLGEINMGKLQTTMNQKIAHYEATLNDRNKKIQ